jgi:hypothetical protein
MPFVLICRFIPRLHSYSLRAALNKRIIIAFVLVAVGLIATWPLVGQFFGHSSNQAAFTGRLEPGVEAGCVLLHADDGTQYLLIGRSDYPPLGTRVAVTGYFETDVATYCMQGDAVIHVLSIFIIGPTSSLSISYTIGTATASTATVMTAPTSQSISISGIPIAVSGYLYTVIESPQCYPQCGLPSFILAYLYVPPGANCTGGMACFPPPRYYRLVSIDGNPFLPTAPNGTYVTHLTGLLVTPSSWNCESFYVPKTCMSGDIYVQTIQY